MAAVFAVGVGGTYFGMEQTNELSRDLSSVSSGMLMGHVTATALNENGEIYAYRQSDNAIVESGMEIIASQVFQGLNGSAAGSEDLCPLCTYSGNLVNGANPVDSIGIGTNGTGVTSQDYFISDGLGNKHGAAGCQNVSVTWTAGTANASKAGGAHSYANIAMIGINGTATFGPSALCANTYLEAGAFDNDTSGIMFARNTYNSVTLGAADSLIINWNFQFNDS